VSLPHAASVVSDIATAAASAMPRVIFMVSPFLGGDCVVELCLELFFSYED
jgi:hypothetical protein